MNKITKKIKVFKSVILPTIAQKYRPFADQVILLFADRKIEKTKEAEKLLVQLSSRGMGPQSAIDKITKKYSKQESITGRLSRPTPKSVANKIKTFFVSGVIDATITYTNKLKKTGLITEQTYQLPEQPYALQIKAKNRAEAEEKFIASAEDYFMSTRSGQDSNVNRTSKFQSATVNSVSSESDFTASSENSQLMKASSPVEYSLIPADVSLFKKIRGFVCSTSS